MSRLLTREQVEGYRRDGLPQVREDPLDHWCLKDGRNDLELAAAIRAVPEIDLGDITMWVVPSCQGVFRLSTTCPAALHCTRSLASAGG